MLALSALSMWGGPKQKSMQIKSNMYEQLEAMKHETNGLVY